MATLASGFMLIFTLVAIFVFLIFSSLAAAMANRLQRFRGVFAALPFISPIAALFQPMLGVALSSAAIGFHRKLVLFPNAGFVAWGGLAFAFLVQAAIAILVAATFE